MERNWKHTRALALLILLLPLVTGCQNQAEPATATPSPAPSPSPTLPPPTATATMPRPTATAPSPTATATVAAATEALPDELPVFSAAACRFNVPPGREVSCGYVTVPADHSQPDNGATMRLHVARFASDSPNPAPDPILYLEGGPGGDALEAVPLIFEERFAPFLRDRELIMFDQRGTGYSEPSLACPEYTELSYSSLEVDLTPAEEVDLTVDALLACRQRLLDDGVNFTLFNSAQNAADVAALRLALGVDQWNLWGISYGTRLAQTVMRDHPQGVRSVVLDSSYPLSADLVTEITANADRAFDVFFAGCAADAACSQAHPNLETTFFDLVASLDETPLAVPVINLFTRDQYDALIGGDDLIGVLFQSLYSAELIPDLPQLIADVAAGETQELGLLLSSFLLNTEFISVGMQYAVQCNEEVAFSQPGAGAAAAAAFPDIGDTFATSAAVDERVCAAWGAGTAPARENEPVTSDLPTLILAGEYDPITPPAWGEQVAATLSQASLYLYPGLGHGVSLSDPCPREMVLAFFADPSSPPDDGCIAAMAGPDFAAAESDVVAEVTMVPFTADLGVSEIAGVVPEGWREAGPGVFSRGQGALDQTTLLQQGIPGVDATTLLTLLTSQLGLSSTPASEGSYAGGGRSWQLYSATLQGLPVDLALAEDEQAAYVVLLISTVEERDTLIEAVFQPAMDALAIP